MSFAASVPRVELGGLVEVVAPWVSMVAALGFAVRPSLARRGR
jgi:hypothetical protein